MIYDVRSEYFKTYLSRKQGASIVKDKEDDSKGDAMHAK